MAFPITLPGFVNWCLGKRENNRSNEYDLQARGDARSANAQQTSVVAQQSLQLNHVSSTASATSTPSTPSITSAVFRKVFSNKTELLTIDNFESFFRFLDLRSQVHCRAVSRTWKDHFDGIPSSKETMDYINARHYNAYDRYYHSAAEMNLNSWRTRFGVWYFKGCRNPNGYRITVNLFSLKSVVFFCIPTIGEFIYLYKNKPVDDLTMLFVILTAGSVSLLGWSRDVWVKELTKIDMVAVWEKTRREEYTLLLEEEVRLKNEFNFNFSLRQSRKKQT